jgi:rRNA maturation RNase YbeY
MDRPILEIHNQAGPGVALPCLRVYLEQALVFLTLRRGSWSITLVDDPTMRDLHQRTMDIDTTTDVLTFDLRDRGQGDLDLDTVICVDEAARQATAHHHALREEILLYAIHSLLHVLGYNDTTSKAAARMHKREDELLVRLGVGPVYARPPSPERGKQRAAGKAVKISRARRLVRRQGKAKKPGKRLARKSR